MNNALKRAAAQYGLEHVESREELFECLMEIMGDETTVTEYLDRFVAPSVVLKITPHRLDKSIAEIVRGYHIACENQDADGAERLDAMYTDLVAMRDKELHDLGI